MIRGYRRGPWPTVARGTSSLPCPVGAARALAFVAAQFQQIWPKVGRNFIFARLQTAKPLNTWRPVPVPTRSTIPLLSGPIDIPPLGTLPTWNERTPSSRRLFRDYQIPRPSVSFIFAQSATEGASNHTSATEVRDRANKCRWSLGGATVVSGIFRFLRGSEVMRFGSVVSKTLFWYLKCLLRIVRAVKWFRFL